jgi:TRAP-type C4-dicarboxylate transport system permease small subunit
MLDSVIAFLLKGIRAFVMGAVGIIFVEVIYEVFSRYVLQQAVPWGAEVSQTLMIWMAFIGACCAFHKGQHMAIDYLVRSIPIVSLRKAVIHAANAIVAGLLICGLLSGVEVVSMTWADRTTALQISCGILYLAYPVSMGMMLFFLTAKYAQGKGSTLAGEAVESDNGGDVL